VVDVFRGYGMSEQDIAPVVQAVCADQKRWVDFMMRFELGLEKPEASRARNSSLTIACAYIAGGLVPLSPYIVTATPKEALVFSIAVTLIALAVFGWMKGYFTGTPPFRGAMQTAFIGGLAAAAAFLIARLVS
jgi:VIT1/CCC1 family predicted Fe2+/Mn2+ transporter